jgi:hypothetical protein
MGGGSGQSSTTSTQSGPAKYVVPYAQQQTAQAGQLFSGQNYPQQQTAAFTPDQTTAMQMVEGMTPGQQSVSNASELANLQLALGLNPSVNAGTSALTNIATGQNPSLNAATAANQSLLNDPTIAAAQAANQNIISGANLNPSSNPALQAYLQAGMTPMIQNYEQAIAPNIVANAVGSGGLGGSGESQAFQNAQSALAQGLGTYTSGVIEPAYEAGLSQQQQAIQTAPSLLQPEQTAISQAAGLLQPQISAATSLPGMLAPQQTAISQTPGLVSGAYTPSSQLQQVGTQQQQQAQNVLNTIFGNQMTPYQMAQTGAGLVGQLSGGGGQSFQVSSQPGGSMK